MPQNSNPITRYILLICGTFILNACTAAAVPKTVPKTVQVDILKYKFIPAEVTINKGDTILWVNQEKRQYHSVWFEQMGEPEPDYFFPGESFSRTFDEAGKFPYRCGPHPEMLGAVTVK